MLAPAVIGMRVPLLAAEAQSGNGQIGVETMRAVTEKAAAVADGLFAAQVSMASAAMMFWPELLSGRTPSLLSGAAVEKAMHEALRPARRAVKANYRRLRAK
jgi:hypothetical protein